MKVKIKKLHPWAKIPKYAKPGDAGLDLTCVDIEYDETRRLIKYKTGLAVEIPEGYVGLLFPRSSVMQQDLALTNSVGVIDSGYRGEVTAVFRPTTNFHIESYDVGDRVVQLLILPYPQIELEEAESLSNTERGTGGYGSTGN